MPQSTLQPAFSRCSRFSAFSRLRSGPYARPAVEKTRSGSAEHAGAAKNWRAMRARLGSRPLLSTAFHHGRMSCLKRTLHCSLSNSRSSFSAMLSLLMTAGSVLSA